MQFQALIKAKGAAKNYSFDAIDKEKKGRTLKRKKTRNEQKRKQERIKRPHPTHGLAIREKIRSRKKSRLQ